MALPITREEFKQYCLRSLGKTVIDINSSDEQLEDRIDEALQYYADYHFDGTEKHYYKYQVTSTDKTNNYITIPENIIGVVSIFPVGASMSTNNLFNIRYQIALNDLYTLTSSSMVPYFSAMQHIALIEELLVGKQPIRYNRHRNILHIDMDWNTTNVDDYLVVECYQVVEPGTYANVWKDRWLLTYGTALFKRQWGNNTKKFTGMTLPNGVMYTGQQIYDEAIEEIKQLHFEMINSYSLPVSDMVG